MLNITDKVLLAIKWTPRSIQDIASEAGVSVTQARNAIKCLRAKQIGVANTARHMFALSHFMGLNVKRAA